MNQPDLFQPPKCGNWEDEIPQDVWDRDWLPRIHTPRPMWKSDAERDEFMDWCKEKQDEYDGRTA